MRKGLAVVAALLTVAPMWASDALTRSLEVHRAARQAILSCECSVAVEMQINRKDQPEVGYTKSGQFWRSGTLSRIRESSATGPQVDLLIEGSIAKSLLTSQGETRATIAPAERPGGVYFTDAWVGGLLKLNNPGTTKYFELEQLVALATNAKAIETKGSGFVLTLEFAQDIKGGPPWTVTVELDGRTNGLVKRVTYNVMYLGKKIAREDKVVQFAEPKPGIFFPAVTTFGSTFPDGGTGMMSVRLSDIRLNSPIPPKRFQMLFPRGIVVENLIEMTGYPADEQGRPIGPVTPRRRVAPPPQLLAAVPGGPSEEPPQSWPVVGLIASSVLVMLSGGYWLWQRRQERRARH